MNVMILALMHFLVDFICALSMFGRFLDGNYEYLLVYNFCAFALQMPLGTLLDLCYSKGKSGRGNFPLIWTGSGVLLTVAGAMLHPAVLGLGNALFHVGGGMDVILEDFDRGRKGKNLGIFVAPGAIGLFLGTLLGKGGMNSIAIVLSAAALAAGILVLTGNRKTVLLPEGNSGGSGWILGLACFAVVVLRSYIGLSVSFSWKTGAVYPVLAVLAVALGKLSGGLLAARFGMMKTVQVSLLAAAGCFILGEIPAFGLAALLFFNMSMPVTLYLLAENLPEMPGFSFGLLTFGLFLGFLPVYAGTALPVSGGIMGAIGSIVSVLLLSIAGKMVKKAHVSS